MNILKNSIYYITRKKIRTVVVFLILSVILSTLYACLNITKSIGNIEKSVYELSNSSFSISKKISMESFELKEIQNINKVKNIKYINPIYEGFSKLIDRKVVEKDQLVKRDDIEESLKNLLSVNSMNDTSKNELFKSDVFSLKSGRHINERDSYKILIHEELAKKNGLKLKDKIKLSFINMMENNKKFDAVKFEIVGIFSGRKQENYNGLSSDLSENTVFTDYLSSQKSLGINSDKKIVNKVSLYVERPEKIKEVIKEIEGKLIDLNKFKIEKDTKAYDDISESVKAMKGIIKIMTFSIMIGGMIVLSLILILWLRERIYEIGIFLSIGVGKLRIVGQFLLELIFISIPTIIISFIFGNFVIGHLIKGIAKSSDSITTTEGFIKNGLGIENIITLIESYGILILIMIVSVLFTSGMILRKKPKEILSKIS